MPRNHFSHELDRLNGDLADMGRRVDDILLGTIRSLKTMNIPLAGSIVPSDAEINTMEKAIEQTCIQLIALQQPLAHDLRAITAALKIITDLERIADQCADICEILATVPTITALKASPRMLTMFEKARHMVSGALDAYIRQDTAAAEAVCREDDEVDALFSASVLELCAQIGERPGAIPENVDFMFIAKYIERMADHATNIAEWTIFVNTGVHPDLNSLHPAAESGQDGEEPV